MKYDATIIGAGIGGLAAGASLSFAGYKPLILEKQDVIGGRYYAGDYKGYRLTNAAWYILGPDGPVMQLARDAGLESKLEIASAPIPYWKYWIDGKFFDMPEKGGAKALLSLVAKPEEVAKVLTPLTKALRWQEPSDNISFREWLSAYTDNNGIFKIYEMMVHNVTGAKLDTVPAGEFIRILRHLGTWGSRWLLPRGHVRPLTDGFADAVKANGGDIWTKARVKKIVIEDLTAKGVIIERDGKEINIESQVVINNCPPRDMIKLAGEENFDKGYLKQIYNMKSSGMINVYWGCDRLVLDYAGPICYPMEEPSFIAVDYSLTWPDLTPEGKYSLLAGGDLPAEPYDATDLEKCIERLEEKVYEHFPVLKEHGEVLVVQVFHKTWPGIWAIPGEDIENKSPVENLYVVGDGAKPSGTAAAEGAVAGANLVVEDIKRRIKPVS